MRLFQVDFVFKIKILTFSISDKRWTKMASYTWSMHLRKHLDEHFDFGWHTNIEITNDHTNNNKRLEHSHFLPYIFAECLTA